MRVLLCITLCLAAAALSEGDPVQPLYSNPRFEAEDGTYNGVTFASDTSDFTGRGYVGNFMNTNSLDIKLQTTPGPYTIMMRYRSVWSAKVTTIHVNNQPVGDVALPQTAAWVQVSLGRVALGGSDTLTILSGWGYYEVDNVELVPFIGGKVKKLNVSNCDSKATPQAKGLLHYLHNNFGQKILSGQQDLASLQWVETNIGKTPAILGCDLMDYSPTRVQNGATSHEVENAIAFDARNGIVALVWHWNAPACLYNTADKPWWRGFYTEATCFDLAAALAEGVNGPNYKLLLSDIDAIAVQLKRLSDANIPVLFRPLHEAEGGWFWWGAKGAAPAVSLYKILYKRITQTHKLHNIVWVWNSLSPEWNPGKKYYDVIAYDSYPAVGDHSPQTSKYDSMVKLVGGKRLVAMAENGCIPDPDQALSLKSLYSYFTTWAGDTISDGKTNPRDFVQRVYNSNLVLTLDELGAWKNS